MELEQIRTALTPYLQGKNVILGELEQQPGRLGCFERDGNWYLYETDEHNFCSINGPYAVHGVICAMLKKLRVKDPQFVMNDDERTVWLNNHFRSFAEIDRYRAETL